MLRIHRKEPYFQRYKAMWTRTGLQMHSCNVENTLNVSDTTAANSVMKYPRLVTLERMAKGFSKKITENEDKPVTIEPLVVLQDGVPAYGIERGVYDEGSKCSETLVDYINRVVEKAYKDAAFPEEEKKPNYDKDETFCSLLFRRGGYVRKAENGKTRRQNTLTFSAKSSVESLEKILSAFNECTPHHFSVSYYVEVKNDRV